MVPTPARVQPCRGAGLAAGGANEPDELVEVPLTIADEFFVPEDDDFTLPAVALILLAALGVGEVVHCHLPAASAQLWPSFAAE